MRFARASKRMQEMVYDDTRWVQRLQCMDCWNEAEARKRFEDAMRRKWEAQRKRQDEEAKKMGISIGANGVRKTSTTLFDAGVEEEKRKRSAEVPPVISPTVPNVPDGFETLSLSTKTGELNPSLHEPSSLLEIFKTVKSVRGFARQEYGRIYKILAPFYFDLARSKSHTDPVIFRVYRDPEQQAQMLAQLLRFSRSDWAEGWRQREEKLESMMGIFENAVLRELEQGYEAMDIDGRMHRYAHVLNMLNGGHAGVDIFIQKHFMFSERERFGRSLDCINHASSGDITLQPSREFFQELAECLNEQAGVIDRVFPPEMQVQKALLEKVGEDVITEYVNPLFDQAHETNIQSYLKAVSGIFEQSAQFGASLKPCKGAGADFRKDVNEMIVRVFEPHVDLYLQDELEYFKLRAEAEVEDWEKKLSEQDASTESFFMANVNRQADKKDFLSSFKKVVMMPVNVLPFAASKPITNGSVAESGVSPNPSRPDTPNSTGNRASVRMSTLTEGPTNELAAKAAIMASRLEGIKSLFSIEVALNLIHNAKTSLERAAHFVRLGGQTGEEAREQCEAIFVVLLQILGSRHVQTGFDKAVEHLSKYNPREISDHQSGVTPLVTFLELVNVGDLISQMIDVFYEQQLAATKLADRNDFLDPAVKAKKKFEQMLDERVAAGLNKGIDVLMDEVEYISSTTQLPSDYNPPPPTAEKPFDMEIGTTPTAQQVVELVRSHTDMLVGSTDKNMLDVFNQEVGLRLFTCICKHLKRQRISTTGSLRLISDMNLYFSYIQTLKNKALLQYFKALRELSQIYLIEPQHAREMATVVADGERFGGVWRAEEVYEFVERRADWFVVRRDVERAMYGIGCALM
jgi:recyclin-1